MNISTHAPPLAFNDTLVSDDVVTRDLDSKMEISGLFPIIRWRLCDPSLAHYVITQIST